jgi:putative addiction module component (TIGR02574 family)
MMPSPMPSPLPADIRSLPIADRVHLVEQIWNSIAEDEQSFQLTDAQKAELDRRIEAHDADPTRGTPWEEVKQRLLGE